MDTLSFEKVVRNDYGQEYILAKITINCVPFIDKVVAIELPYAIAEGHPSIAGGYSHQTAESLYKQFTGEWVDEPDDRRVTLLTCECLEDGCWSLQAKCNDTGKEIIWRGFSHNHRGEWDYTALGEFHFDKKRYIEEVLKLRGFYQSRDS